MKVNKISPQELIPALNNTDNKIYTKNMCKFATQRENLVASGITGLTYIATRISDGSQVEFNNQRGFSRMHNLPWRDVCRCIKGKQISTKEWKFVVKEN